MLWLLKNVGSKKGLYKKNVDLVLKYKEGNMAPKNVGQKNLNLIIMLFTKCLNLTLTLEYPNDIVVKAWL